MTNTNKKRSTKPQQPAKQPRNIPWVGIIFGVVAVALVAAIVFSGEGSIGSEAGEVEVSGSLPQFVATEGDAAIGQTAPEVSGEDFDGDAVTIANDGTPKAVAFLAHWCPHCQAEVPKVQDWVDSGGGVPGVEIMSVATSENTAADNHPASDWLEREGWTAPVIADDATNSAHIAYGGGGFPYWVFIDADGNVAARTAGQLDIPTLEALMQSIAP